MGKGEVRPTTGYEGSEGE